MPAPTRRISGYCTGDPPIVVYDQRRPRGRLTLTPFLALCWLAGLGLYLGFAAIGVIAR